MYPDSTDLQRFCAVWVHTLYIYIIVIEIELSLVVPLFQQLLLLPSICIAINQHKLLKIYNPE